MSRVRWLGLPGVTDSIAAVRGIETTSMAFRTRLVQIAQELGIDPDWLAAVISFESDGTFSPSVLNKAGSGAVGLIQFTYVGAKAVGKTQAELAAMTAEGQLEYVRAYYISAKGKLHSLDDTYLKVLYPDAIGLPPGAVIWKVPEIAYVQNKGLDSNGDGMITVSEMTSPVKHVLAKAGSNRVPVAAGAVTPPPADNKAAVDLCLARGGIWIDGQGCTLPPPRTASASSSDNSGVLIFGAIVLTALAIAASSKTPPSRAFMS